MVPGSNIKIFDTHLLMVDVMGKKKVLGIVIILGLTLLNVWMARYVVKPMKEQRLYKQANLFKSRPETADILVISVEDIHPIEHLKEANKEDEKKTLRTNTKSKGVTHAHSVGRDSKAPNQANVGVSADMWKIDNSLMNLDIANLARIKISLQNLKDTLQARKTQNDAIETSSGFPKDQGRVSSAGMQTVILDKIDYKKEQVTPAPGVVDFRGAMTARHSSESGTLPKVSIFRTNQPSSARHVTSVGATAVLPLLTNVKIKTDVLKNTEKFGKNFPQKFKQTGADFYPTAISVIKGRVHDSKQGPATRDGIDQKQNSLSLHAREVASPGHILKPVISMPENGDIASPVLLPGHHMMEGVDDQGKSRQYDFIRRMNEQMVENIARENKVQANTAEMRMLENILRDIQAGQMRLDPKNLPGQ